MIEPTKEEQKMILEEVADHIRFWSGSLGGSDRCKRATVEKHLETPPRECHLGRKPMEKASEKIDWMIEQKLLVFIPGRTGGYLQCPKT
jgi:hypothetical protein